MACRHIVGAPKMALRRFLLPISSTPVISTQYFSGGNVLHSSARRFAPTQDIDEKPTFIRKFRSKIGWTEFPEAIYRRVAVYLYEQIDIISIDEFFKEFEMEDTFYSWFLIMELHLWMLMSTASKYGKEGEFIKKALANTMWDDVGRRIKLIANLTGSDQRKTIGSLHDEMSYALVLYDEGIQTNDRRLAEAIWLRIFRGKTANPQHLERLVCYTRKQVLNLDAISRESFSLRGEISWTPLKECRI